MKKICLLFFACCFACCIGGCSLLVIPPLQDAPEDVPRARLRIVSFDSHSAVRGYYAWGRSGPITVDSGSNGRSLGMPNPERIGDHPFAEIYLKTGTKFEVNFSRREFYGICQVGLGFVPEEGKNYEAHELWLPEAKKCGVIIFVLSENGLWNPVPRDK